MEGFKAFPIQQMADHERDAMWEGIRTRLNAASTSSSSSSSPSLSSLLSRFLLLTFADLKSHRYAYWFCFPALVLEGLKFGVEKREDQSVRVEQVWTEQQQRALLAGYAAFAASAQGKGDGYFAILKSTASSDLHVCSVDEGLRSPPDQQLLLAFIDPCPLSSHMGWPARNLLTYAFLSGRLTDGKAGEKDVQVLSFRDTDLAAHAQVNLSALSSRLFTVRLSASQPPSAYLAHAPVTAAAAASLVKVTGWERNKAGKAAPRLMDLGSSMDPLKLAEASVDLNLKLMRWRALPALDLPLLARTKCLLLGAGTLGCNVSRALLGWGVRHITFVDSGKVSYSNPVRQSLFTFEDARDAKPKAACAAAALKQIYPNVHSSGVQLTIPMPGHQVSPSEEKDVLEAIVRLQELVDQHDAVFLLTDSRESRWLPTVMCAASNKLCLNTALGFDTYVVMRHGDNFGTARKEALEKARGGQMMTDEDHTAASSSGSGVKPHGVDRYAALGCYFCNDVVAPTDVSLSALPRRSTWCWCGRTSLRACVLISFVPLSVLRLLSPLSVPLGPHAGPAVHGDSSGSRVPLLRLLRGAVHLAAAPPAASTRAGGCRRGAERERHQRPDRIRTGAASDARIPHAVHHDARPRRGVREVHGLLDADPLGVPRRS
jgi:ubiquitin-like modifier-activating enzyme ATG7